MKVCEKCKHYDTCTHSCAMWTNRATSCISYSALVDLCPRCHHYNRDSCVLPPTTEARTVSKCSGFLSSIHEICTRCGHYDGEALICTAPYRVVSSDALICSAFIAKAEQKCGTCIHWDTESCPVTRHYRVAAHDGTFCNMYCGGGVQGAKGRGQSCGTCRHNHSGVCTLHSIIIPEDKGYLVDDGCGDYQEKETSVKRNCGTCKHRNDAECEVTGNNTLVTWGSKCMSYVRVPSNATLTFEEYQRKAVRTAKRLTSLADKIQRGALGIAGEAGEIAELIKKNQYQDRPLNYDDLADEMGDLLWYLAVMADDLDMGLCNIAANNIKKLEGRYPDGYASSTSNS